MPIIQSPSTVHGTAPAFLAVQCAQLQRLPKLRLSLFLPSFLLLVASSSDSLGLWCVCCRRHFRHFDVLGGSSISRVLGGIFLCLVFLCLVFLCLFGIVFCGLFLFHLLRVFLVGGFAVVDVFLLSGLALLVWRLGTWLRVSVGVASMTLTRRKQQRQAEAPSIRSGVRLAAVPQASRATLLLSPTTSAEIEMASTHHSLGPLDRQLRRRPLLPLPPHQLPLLPRRRRHRRLPLHLQ